MAGCGHNTTGQTHYASCAELNAWIATHVMKWERCKGVFGTVAWEEDHHNCKRMFTNWSPSTSLPDAFRALEASGLEAVIEKSEDGCGSLEYRVSIRLAGGHGTTDWHTNSTLPLAICNALREAGDG